MTYVTIRKKNGQANGTNVLCMFSSKQNATRLFYARLATVCKRSLLGGCYYHTNKAKRFPQWSKIQPACYTRYPALWYRHSVQARANSLSIRGRRRVGPCPGARPRLRPEVRSPWGGAGSMRRPPAIILTPLSQHNSGGHLAPSPPQLPDSG